MAREFDVVVFGASGFTGRLVAEYLVGKGTCADAPKWALAGRNPDKLARIAAEVGAGGIPVIAADADDPASLEAMAKRTEVVLTTVGPYQLYGAPLVAACAKTGTGYVDLCGEPAWMRQMIDAHEAEAKKTGARIVFSCGFDSAPFDLGVFRVQALAREAFGAPAPRVQGLVRRMKGTFSGGTKASMDATLAAARKDPALGDLLRNPFALTPGFEGPKQPSGSRPLYDEGTGSWLAPFVMATINTRNVHRSNYLMDFAYGRDFLYSEMLMTGPGEKGEKIANAVASDRSGGMGEDLKPGDGPSREERETGLYDLLFIAAMPDGRTQKLSVKGDRDPGYGSTSRMIAEAALCLAKDSAGLAGGFYTTAPAFGDKLIARFQENASIRFQPEN